MYDGAKRFATVDRFYAYFFGGILTTIGGLIGAYFTHRWHTNYDKANRSDQKFEELYTVLFSHYRWIEKQKSEIVFGLDKNNLESPLSKIKAIIFLYFKDLKKFSQRT